MWCQGSAGYYGEEEIFNSQGFLDGIGRRSLGKFGLANTSQATWFRYDTKQLDRSDALETIEVLYKWWHCIVVSWWNASNGSNTVLILDHKLEFQEWFLGN